MRPQAAHGHEHSISMAGHGFSEVAKSGFKDEIARVRDRLTFARHNNASSECQDKSRERSDRPTPQHGVETGLS